MFISTSDFTNGLYHIPQSKGLCNTALEDYIMRYELEMLQDLLGCELTNLFLADYNAVAGIFNTPAYQTLYDRISEDLPKSYDGENDNTLLRNNGMKDMLVGFIFFYYMRDFVNNRTLIGNTNPDSSISETISSVTFGLTNFYNNSIKSYKVIQEYINLHDDVVEYATYNGIEKQIASNY